MAAGGQSSWKYDDPTGRRNGAPCRQDEAHGGPKEEDHDEVDLPRRGGAVAVPYIHLRAHEITSNVLCLCLL